MYHSGNTVSRAFAFFYVQDHVTNHRAKANLYIRMNNIKPPAYTWWFFSYILQLKTPLCVSSMVAVNFDKIGFFE